MDTKPWDRLALLITERFEIPEQDELCFKGEEFFLNSQKKESATSGLLFARSLSGDPAIIASTSLVPAHSRRYGSYWALQNASISSDLPCLVSSSDMFDKPFRGPVRLVPAPAVSEMIKGEWVLGRKFVAPLSTALWIGVIEIGPSSIDCGIITVFSSEYTFGRKYYEVAIADSGDIFGEVSFVGSL